MDFLKNIGTPELIVIGVILIFLFGGKKLSQWAKEAGQTGSELKKIREDFDKAINGQTSNESDTSSETRELKEDTSKAKKRKGVE